MSSVIMRRGGPDDVEAVLSIWDQAVSWLVARNQVGQWGSEPVSSRPAAVERVQQWSRAPGLTLAQIDGQVVGASVITDSCPSYVAAVDVRETYIGFLVSDRDRAGQGIGSRLVEQAIRDARAADSEVLRVDCWADAPTLLGWYERQGFTRTTTFEVNDGWRGQVFEMPLR